MKKIVAAILSLLMLVTIFAGCSKPQNDVGDSKYPSGFKFQENAFSGKTLHIWTGVSRTGEGESEERYLEFEEATGAKLEFTNITYAEGLAPYSSAIAAGTGPDIMVVDNRQFPIWATGGLLIPLSDVVDFSEDIYKDSLNQGICDFFTYDGKVYAFNTIPTITGCGYIVYRKSLIDEAGLDDPYQLYLEGKWNFNSLNETISALTYDSNEDGTIDKWGLTGYIDYYWLGCAGGDANYVRYDAEGRPSFALDDPDIMECMEEYRYISDQGWFQVLTTPTADFLNGRAAMYGGIITWDCRQFVEKFGVEDIGYVPFPAAPSNTSGIVNAVAHSGAYGIAKCVRDKELLEEWIKYAYFWKRADVDYDIAKQNVIDDYFAGNEEWYNFNESVAKNIFISNAPSFGELENICATNIFWNRSDSVHNLVQALIPAAQAEIDRVFYGE